MKAGGTLSDTITLLGVMWECEFLVDYVYDDGSVDLAFYSAKIGDQDATDLANCTRHDGRYIMDILCEMANDGMPEALRDMAAEKQADLDEAGAMCGARY